MKREYVTPVMECEEFVANEYVATCYVLTCDTIGFGTSLDGHKKCRGNYTIKKDPSYEIDPSWALQKGTWWNGTIEGNPTRTWHHVSVEEINSENDPDYYNHPNASN